MSCEHIQLPDGSTAVICGLRRTKTKPCQFCGKRSTKLCDWKCDKPVKINAEDLQATDTLVTVQKKFRLAIHGLQRFEAMAASLWATITMYGLVFPDGRCFLYYQAPWGKVSVLRPGTCDTPCCDLHSRHVDDDVDYCMSHWDSWSQIR